MKISCQSCAAKYTIADEKVVGKVIKIKCKKCSSTIVVNGNDPAVLAQLQAAEAAPPPDAAAFDDQAATQLVNQPPADMLGGAAPPDEWTVSITDDDQRTMTTAMILSEYATGALSADTYLWKDGMADWLPIHQVEELAPLLAAAAAGPAPAMTPSSRPRNGTAEMPAYDSTMPLVPGQQPLAAAAATSAARRVGGRQSVDLFGANRDDGGMAAMGGGMAGGMGAAGLTQPMGSDKHVGERNETSVLFSLKDLAAAEAAATKQPEKKNPYANRNDRVDDIFSLGSVAASPMLVAPSLNAPYVEPPPPPPPPSVAPTSASPMAAPLVYAPAKKSPVPYIVGGVGALALVASIIFFVVGSGDKSKTADTGATTTTAKEAKTDKTADAASNGSTPTSKTSETVAAAETATTAETGSTSEAVSSATPSGKPDSGKLALTDPKKDPNKDKKDPKDKDKDKKDDPKDKKKDEPKEEPKEEPTKGGGGDAPFDRGAASAAMSGAAGRASGCKKSDGPTGSTKVQVTFQPSGKGTGVSVGAPFAGTPVGSCIAGAFKGLSIPPFSGAAVPVSKTVTIR